MKEISKKIGERIREARDEKGLTQKQLGEFLGYSPMGISYFEQGVREMKVSDIQKIAGYFGKDISFFLSPSLTMFRADKGTGMEAGASKSLSDFDAFLAKRKEK